MQIFHYTTLENFPQMREAMQGRSEPMIRRPSPMNYHSSGVHSVSASSASGTVLSR